jgi:hypothetical protein
MEHPAGLRFITYLSPGIPQTFFEVVVEQVRRALGQRASPSVEQQVSGSVRPLRPISKIRGEPSTFAVITRTTLRLSHACAGAEHKPPNSQGSTLKQSF